MPDQVSAVDSAEAGIEVTCSERIARWFAVQPDIQYIIHPDTDKARDDALVCWFTFYRYISISGDLLMSVRSLLFTTALVTTLTSSLMAAEQNNRYIQTNLVANQTKYQAASHEKAFINAWGIAIRPAGAGGHFWVTAKDTSFEYVGDVHASPDSKLRVLHQDQLSEVKLPVHGDDAFSTGVVFNGSQDSFVITQKIQKAQDITAPAKFIFASDSGIISAWTERKKEDGTFDRPLEAKVVIDESKNGVQFFGLALNSVSSRIYAANFGKSPGIKVFDSHFKPVSMVFDMPFDDNKNGTVDPGEYAPFNVQAFTTPKGEPHVFVTYAKTQQCTEDGLNKGLCHAGELFAGEEDTSQPGQGRLAEFTEEGKLVRVWKDTGKLSAPWGLAYAPADFGALSNMLLVGNFGDGTIAAYDPTTYAFVAYLNDAKGKPVKIEKIWGLLFGNGESLGDKNALYVAAGPNDEKDGLFSVLRPVK